MTTGRTPSQRVSVIAVHGVGNSQPGDTARAVADALARAAGGRCIFEEARSRRYPTPRSPSEILGETLTPVHGKPEKPFVSVRLRGSVKNVDVTVHELYWADLSKGKPTTLSIAKQMIELFPRFLHIARHELASATRDTARWVALLYDGAVLLLGWLLPTLNAALLVFACSLLPFRLACEHVDGVALASILILACVVGPWLVYRVATSKHAFKSLASSALVGATALGVLRAVAGLRWGAAWVFLLGVVGCSFAVRALILQLLAWRRWWSEPLLVFAVLAGVGTAGACLDVDRTFLSRSFVLAVLPVTGTLIVTTWTVLFGALTAVFVGGRNVVRRREASRASWHFAWATIAVTFAVTLFVQAFTFQTLGERAVQQWLGLIVGDDEHVVPLFWRSSKTHFAFDALQLSELLVGGTLLLVGTIAAAWGLIPSISAEIDGGDDANPMDSDHAQRQGAWLTAGRRVLAGLAAFAAPCVFFLPVLGTFIACVTDIADKLPRLVNAKVWAVVLPSGLAAIVALRRARSSLASIWPALGIALDVAAFVRDPADGTRPADAIRQRGRLLLADVGSDAIVIVAHSQGTLLTTDLLASLDETTRKRVVLITLGSPLRALYGTLLRHSFPEVIEALGRPDAWCKEWANLYFAGDYVGRALWASDTDAPYSGTKVEHSAGVYDQCVGAGGHWKYLDRKAVGEKLLAIVVASAVMRSTTACAGGPPAAHSRLFPRRAR